MDNKAVSVSTSTYWQKHETLQRTTKNATSTETRHTIQQTVKNGNVKCVKRQTVHTRVTVSTSGPRALPKGKSQAQRAIRAPEKMAKRPQNKTASKQTTRPAKRPQNNKGKGTTANRNPAKAAKRSK